MKKYLAGEPLQRMAIDIAGPFHPTQRENRYIMVVMDYFTKWACLIPMKEHNAQTCAKHLVEEVFCKIGIPREIHSDQGREFVSELIQEVCQLFQVNKAKTTPWRPQSDRMVERMNRTVGQMLRQYVSEHQTDWDEWLSLCNLAYNSSHSALSSFIPSIL
jgi:transposase InsO family protein